MTKQEFINKWQSWARNMNKLRDTIYSIQINPEQQDALLSLMNRADYAEMELYNIINEAARLNPKLKGE